MSAKAVAYPVQDRNSTTYMTRTDQPMKPRKKLDRTAEKNTLNGILAKNKFAQKVERAFFVSLDSVCHKLLKDASYPSYTFA